MRPRIYFSNDSFPELREVRPWRRQSGAWLRAIVHSLRDPGAWWFFAAQVGITAFVLGISLPAIGAPKTWPVDPFVTALGPLLIMAYLQVSWGGDIMRSHLRAVNDTARHSCPSCGHDMRGHLVGDDEAPVRCPECGVSIERVVFRPPYPIPREFRAFPPWNSRSAAER